MKHYDDSNGFFGALFLSIPFYFLWNYFAPIYFAGLPDLYKQLPFWHCVGLVILVWIARTIALPGGSYIQSIKFRSK